MQTRGQKGFTFLELMITLVIMSIFSAITYVNLNKMIASSTLEKTAWIVWKDLSGIRPMAMKFDQKGIVEFKNRSYLIDKVTKIDTCELPEYIGFAVPAAVGLLNDPFGNAISSDSGGNGNWKDSLVVNRDAIGTMNSGYIVISSSRLSKVCYYIGVSDSSQMLFLYKWTGTSWIKK